MKTILIIEFSLQLLFYVVAKNLSWNIVSRVWSSSCNYVKVSLLKRLWPKCVFVYFPRTVLKDLEPIIITVFVT